MLDPPVELLVLDVELVELEVVELDVEELVEATIFILLTVCPALTVITAAWFISVVIDWLALT